MARQRIYHHPTKRDVEVPNLDLLSFLLDSEHCAAQDDQVVHFEAANPTNKITKSELRDLTQRIAHGLRHFYALSCVGPKKDVVTVISHGQILAPAAFLGIIAAGGVYSAASPSCTLSELSRQIQIGQSRVLICGAEHKALAAQAMRERNLPLRNVLLLDSTAGSWSLKSLDGDVDVLNSGNKITWQRITDRQMLKESLIVILWSSGTTGLPKGVMLSHLNLVAETYLYALSAREWVANEMEKGTYVAKQQQTLSHLPISHIAGLFGYFIAPMYNGITVIWMRQYVWEDLLKYLKQYTITVWYTVPSIWLRITKSPEIKDQLKSLEGVSTGASPMDGELMKGINKKIGDGKTKAVGQTWGLSETTGAVTAMPKGDEGDDTGCIGRVLPGVELRLVDENYNDVDPDKQEGELIVRSVVVTNGYYNDAEATKEAFHEDWFCSGDVAVMRDGKFYIVDRKKELLKYKGLQVAPAEIENLLFQHPQIAEAAVIGVPSPEDSSTDLPRAYVVPKDGKKINADEVKKFVADQLAPYKQLRGGVVFVDEIPKNAIGKFLRRELRERAKKELSGQGTARESKL